MNFDGSKALEQRMARHRARQRPVLPETEDPYEAEAVVDQTPEMVESRMALYDQITKDARGGLYDQTTKDARGGAMPLPRWWLWPFRAALVSIPVGGAMFAIGYAASPDARDTGIWAVILAGLAIVILYAIRLSCTCGNCGYLGLPVTTGRDYIDMTRGYGVEQRTYQTYHRDPTGGGGLTNPSIGGYGIYPDSQTTVSVSYPTETHHYLVRTACRNCRAAEQHTSSITRRIG